MNALVQYLLSPGSSPSPATTSAALLILRVCVGGLMLFGHGWGKLVRFSELSGRFPDPLGLGSFPTYLLALLAEVLCSVLVVLGLATRVATLPLIATMTVAAVVIHADDPFSRREPALLFLTAFITLFVAGAGKYSLDGLRSGRRR